MKREERRWFSRTELAAYLACDPITIWRHVKAGRLPKPHKLGNGFSRYDQLEVDAALSGNGANHAT